MISDEDISELEKGKAEGMSEWGMGEWGMYLDPRYHR